MNRSSLYYYINEKKYVRVTSVLSVISKPALVNWAARVEREMVMNVSADLYDTLPKSVAQKASRTWWLTTLRTWLGKEKAKDKLLAKAGEIGSQAHALIEWTLKNELCSRSGPQPEIGAEATWAFSQWQRWKDSVKLKPLSVEQVVWSDKYGFAGTLDLLCEIDSGLTVCDWKTGKAVYAEAHLQNAAYRKAIKEMGHGDPKRGLICRLPKVKTDPEFEAVEAEDLNKSFDIFLKAMDLWDWQQNHTDEKWRQEEIKPVPEKQEGSLTLA